MDERHRLLARNLATLARCEKERKRPRPRTADHTLQALLAERVRAHGRRHDAAASRRKNVDHCKRVSRLERGLRTRPTLRTIESYAQAVGAHVEIRVRTRR
jgi:hypothetical protein